MEKGSFGHTGKLLRVNLESEKITVEKPEESYYKRYFGGRGIIMHTLLTEVPPHVDPLGPENKLIFATGPLTGHKLIGTGRMSAGAKSPLSGGCGEAEAGGFFGAELKRAGYDGIIIEGVARRPVYLKVFNDTVEIRDAGKIWGVEVKQAIEGFHQDLGEGKLRAAVIGPGGERQVRFANIIVDCKGAFGRCGLGAVMGSKRLKGIVLKGDNPPLAAAPEKVTALNRIMKTRYKNCWAVKGTGAVMKAYEAIGNLPIRNFAGGNFPDVEKIDALAFKREYGDGMRGCFNCPIRCKKRMKEVQGGAWEIDPIYGGPEYETLGAFGPNLMIDNLQAICKAHEICNRNGLDTISAGGTIAFAMECFENGILTLNETDGIPLHFGNAEAMLKVLEKIAGRQGRIGNLLAEGSRQAAEIIGRDSLRFAMQVKGEEIPLHEPRYQQGLGLHYSLHATGADHCTGFHDFFLDEMLEDWESLNVAESIPYTELSPRKVRMMFEIGLWMELTNYLGVCVFIPWKFAEIQEAVSAITGWPVTSWKLMKAVERGITLMRIFNLREGFTRDDDKLPDRFYHSPSEGPLMGIRIDPAGFKEAQEIHYQMMGWDHHGIPTKGCLAALDLDWTRPYLNL